MPEEKVDSNTGENKMTVTGWVSPKLTAFIFSILRKWKLFLLIGFLGGVGGFFYAYFQKPVYESRLTFALDGGSGENALSSAMNLAAQFGLGVGSGQTLFDGDNILEILKSRRIVEEVLLTVDTFNGNRVTLADYFIDISGARRVLLAKPHLRGIRFPPGIQRQQLSYLQDSVLNNAFLDLATNAISASRPDKKLGIYELKVKTLNEQFTKDFTDRLLLATINFYTEITSRKDRETLEILEQRVASLKSNVGESIDTRASGEDANVNPAFAAAQAQATKQLYNMQAYGEAYKEMFKTLELARYQYLKKIPLLQVIDHADYPMKRIKLGKLKTAVIGSFAACFVAFFAFWIGGLLRQKP